MQIILNIIKEAYFLLNQMSVYLVFGFLFAGILHVFIKEEIIAKHLGKNNFLSVIKASLFGIPLPLCSCGVIPAALSLRKSGASRGAVLSFLISTPTTGIDSIFATYALLGGVFTVYRVVASFVIAVFAGVLANLFLKKEELSFNSSDNEHKCKLCHNNEHSLVKHNVLDKIKGVFTYAFGDLLGDVSKWLLIGILIGGMISSLIPETLVVRYLGSGWQSIFIMLLVGIPMYVCSSGSLPIVAALILKGMNPGAAFVFLLAGPATNSVALTVIASQFGKKTVFIFLSSIIGCGLGLGFLLNYLWGFLNIDITQLIVHHSTIIPSWMRMITSIFLLLGILLNIIKNKKNKQAIPVRG